LALKTPPTSCLEVGVRGGHTFEGVAASRKTAVDPRPLFELAKNSPHAICPAASDQFFAEITPDETFDLVFIDGFHSFRQAFNDFVNSLKHLREQGLVPIDDTVPIDQFAAVPTLEDARRE